MKVLRVATTNRGKLREFRDILEPLGFSVRGIDDLKRPNDAFEVGEELTMKVTRVDVPNHRLILSVKAWLGEQDDIALAEWTSKRNQARARIVANPPVESHEPRPAGKHKEKEKEKERAKEEVPDEE